MGNLNRGFMVGMEAAMIPVLHSTLRKIISMLLRMFWWSR